MCGIVGASSTRNVVPILIDGIRRLEYRGYDSAGLAVVDGSAEAPHLAHLVHAHWHGKGGGDLLEAVRMTVAEFQGAYAIAVISTREPGRIVGARAGSPLVVGIGADDHFLASDAAALLSVTRRVAYLEDGDLADVRRESWAIHDASGERVERPVVTIE